MDEAISAAASGSIDFITISISTHGLIYGTGTADDFLQALVFSDFDGKTGDGLLADVAFKAYLDRVPRTCGVEIWIDACYSATATRGIHFERRSRSLRNPSFDPATHRIEKSPLTSRRSRGELDNIVVWSACLDSEISADMYNATLQEGWGAFNEAWCDAFDAAPAGMTRRSLMSNVLVALAAAGVPQHPQISFQLSGT